MERLRPSEGQRDGSRLIQNLQLKKVLLERGDEAHKEIKTALVVDGGGMRGVYAGGVVTGLEEAGMREVFDCVVGISSGAAAAAYFLSGQAELGTSIYYEELARGRFVSLLRPTKILDLDLLAKAFCEYKPLNQKAIRRARSHFFIGVTRPADGKGVFVDAKAPSIDIPTAILASSALPLVYNRTFAVNGLGYCDGSIGCGLPIDFVLGKGCNNILVVINRPFGKKRDPLSLIERILVSAVMRDFPFQLRTAYLRKNKLYNESLDKLAKLQTVGGITVGVLCPKSMPVGRLSMDATKLREVAQEARRQTLRLFRSSSGL